MNYIIDRACTAAKRSSSLFFVALLSGLLAASLKPVMVRGDEAAKTRVFDSGPQRITVIELYTSEGCSSCPPAEAYLNGLKDHSDLWQGFIPMAFHVDYWDYLGWQDPYADASHTERQHRYARHHRARTVYTPAFFVNGAPWRNASMEDTPAADGAEVGQLRVEVDGEKVHVNFEPLNKIKGPLSYNIALLGMGLESSIKRGERAGGQASHEFVVLKRRVHTADELHWQTTVPKAKDDHASNYALAVWVSRADAPVPLQATGGYIPEDSVD